MSVAAVPATCPDVGPPDDPVRDRFRGAIVGLAVGDALGATVEFQPRGSFPPPLDLVGGGPFKLKPGEWTDDTSQALCLATSLIERRGWDARDCMTRLHRWMTEGYLSVNGRCFDIGSSSALSLREFGRKIGIAGVQLGQLGGRIARRRGSPRVRLVPISRQIARHARGHHRARGWLQKARQVIGSVPNTVKSNVTFRP